MTAIASETKQSLPMKENTPKLRFPEFEGEWKFFKLEALTSKIGSGKTPKGGEEVYQSFGIQFIRSQNVNNDTLNIDTTHIPNDVHDSMKSSKVLPNDILLNITGGSIGRSCVVPYDFTEGNVNQHVSIIRLKKDNPKFLQSILSSWKGQKLIFQGMTGSGREGLNFESIKGFKIAFPQLEEQKKIATFLTSVDKHITLLTTQKTKLVAYKKGVMQQLFSPCHSEPVEEKGRKQLRFKQDNGNPYPNWEEKKLGEVCNIIMGQSPSSNSYNSDEIGVPLIQGNADLVNRLSKPRNWTTEKTKECNIGDLILTVRAPVGAVAKSIHNACIGRGVCAIRNNSKSVNEFIYQFLLDYETKWTSLEQGSTFTAVSGLEIKKIKIQLPCLEEQQKIASFLSSIDVQIEQVTNQIDKTKTFKKGLLQQMFV